MPAVYSQHGFDARFDWSEAGLLALIPFAGTVVIADVLSYSTAVDTAVSRGAAVYPARWKDERAERLATEMGAYLAVPRNRVSPDHPDSLSPPTLRNLPHGSLSQCRGTPAAGGLLHQRQSVRRNVIRTRHGRTINNEGRRCRQARHGFGPRGADAGGRAGRGADPGGAMRALRH